MLMCGGENKCCARICPMAFGLALGLTSALVMFCVYVWMMYHGIPAGMVDHMPELTLGTGLMKALWTFLQGTVFGFLLAMFYDLLVRCCKKGCKDKKNCA